MLKSSPLTIKIRRDVMLSVDRMNKSNSVPGKFYIHLKTLYCKYTS